MIPPKTVIFIFKVIISTTLMAWVLHSTGLTTPEGIATFVTYITNANLTLIIIAFLFIPIMDIISTIKWYFLVKAKNLNISYWQLLAFYVVGRFFNMTLPSNIGGDLIRIHLVGKKTQRYADSAAIVFFERLTGLITLVVYALIAASIIFAKFSSPWLMYALIVASLALLLLIWLILDKKPIGIVKKWAHTKRPMMVKIFTKLERMHDSIHEASRDKQILALAFFNSALFYFVAVINSWVTILVFNADISLGTMLLAVPIIMFIMNIPISIGNIGVMEFSYTFTLTLFGIAPQEALSMALLMRVKAITAAGLGAAVYSLMPSEIGAKEQLEIELKK